MITYQPVVFRPAYSMYHRPVLGQQTPPPAAVPPDVTAGMVKTVSGVMGAALVTLSAATAWVGIRTGMKEKGSFFGVAAWVVGVAGVLSGVFELIGTANILMKPASEIQKSIDDARARAAAAAAAAPRGA